MQFSLKIDADKLFKAFERAPLETGREIRRANVESLRSVVRDARLHHAWKSGPSQMAERSLKYEVSPNGLHGRAFIDTGVALHGVFLHEGTKRHFVKPTSKKTLFWRAGGQKFFSRGHYVSGIKGDQFLYKAFERQKPFIIARMQGAISTAFKIAGIKD
jgi:hypothetical protein